MNVDTMFPSKYIGAADLQGRSHVVTMANVVMEEIKSRQGTQNKPVLYFQGKEKGLVLNMTNANSIAELYGKDTDNWRGQAIELYPTRVQFGSEMVDAIRITAPRQTASTPPQQDYAGNPNLPPSKQAEETAADALDDDEIPF